MPKYKSCFVPCCKNTTVTCPDKVFLNVPSNVSARKKWYKAARRDLKTAVSSKSTLYCCEDHFNLEDDLLNFIRFNFYRASGLKTRADLKPGIIPHIFTCQPGRNLTARTPRVSICEKLSRKKLLDELMKSSPEAEFVETGEVASEVVIKDEMYISEIPRPSSFIPEVPQMVERSVQVCIKAHFRSKGIQTTAAMVSHLSSPMKHPRSECSTQVTLKKRKQESSSERSISSIRRSDWVETHTTTSSSFEPDDSRKKRFMEDPMFLIENNPKFHINLMPELMGLIPSMSNACKCPVKNIMLTLTKLKLNTSFVSLGDRYGLSASQASRIFRATLPKLASIMKELIYWPDKEFIRQNLPNPFQRRHKSVESIIDCLEIEIEQPTKPYLQAMTWSEHHKASTFKYLISCTPNGFINFVSPGYGGRCTDTDLAIDCSFLNELKPGMEVMVDRGFKNLGAMLHAKQVKLVRPPRVRSGEKCYKELAMEAKRIASSRTHVKRVIGRLRQFNFISHQACIDNKITPLVDCAVIVCAGLVNLQHPFFS